MSEEKILRNLCRITGHEGIRNRLCSRQFWDLIFKRKLVGLLIELIFCATPRVVDLVWPDQD